MLKIYFAHLETQGCLIFGDTRRACEVFLSLFVGDTYLQTLLTTKKPLKNKDLQKFIHENVMFFLRIFSPIDQPTFA